MADQLTPGSVFPDLTLNVAGGGQLSLPSDITTTYTIALFYRGHW